MARRDSLILAIHMGLAPSGRGLYDIVSLSIANDRRSLATRLIRNNENIYPSYDSWGHDS